MANIKNNASARVTRRRLLEAAGEVFAQRGFEDATIKEITARAGVSVALVNYHFSNKAELYTEVVRTACRDSIRTSRHVLQSGRQADPQRQLYKFIQVFLRNILTSIHPACFALLLNRQLQKGEKSPDSILEEFVCIHQQALQTIISRIFNKQLPIHRLALLCDSIIGQCVYYADYEFLLQHLYADLPPASQRIEQIARHITRFSLLAMLSMKQENTKAITI